MILKKLNNKKTTELTKEILKKYIEKVTVYEDEKKDVVLKYESEIIKN